MTTVYISATYQDLVNYREAVARTLRQMNKVVVSMEDYTASDTRPLDRCLSDVEQCDLYIGIFAWRYGFIPPHNNDERKSITELEYRHAMACEKSSLIFIVEDDAPWPPNQIDRKPEDGDGGQKIAALKEYLRHHHLCKGFKDVDGLALAVSTAVANWQQEQQPRLTTNGPLSGPMPRELSHDVFLAHSDLDAEFAGAISDYLTAQGLRVLRDDRAIFAQTPQDFQRLEKSTRRCHATLLVVSDASLQQMAQRGETVQIVLEVAAARTDSLLTLSRVHGAAVRVAEWQPSVLIDVTGWDPRSSSAPSELMQRLTVLPTAMHPGSQWVGLPIVIAAMTATEALELDNSQSEIESTLDRHDLQRLRALKAAVPASESISQRYGPMRDRWRPFAGAQGEIRAVLQGTIDRLNAEPRPGLRSRMIKPQYYNCDEMRKHPELFRSIFNEITDTGCVVIIDEYSLFHPALQKMLAHSRLLASDLVSLVTVSPSNPYSVSPYDLIERELSERLVDAFARFSEEYDPQCELSVGDDRRLRRWLNLSLPHTVQILREPRPNRQSLGRFARELGTDTRARAGALLYSEGGLL